MASTLELIAQKNVQINSIQSQLPALITSEKEWRAQSKVECKQTLKSKREACQADKVNKANRADALLAEINSKNDAINRLKAEIEEIKATNSANNLATVDLAKQGKSLEALVVEAQGKADASKIVAAGTATATQTTAEADADKKKKTTLIIVAISVVVLIIILLLAILKFKKKSKK